MRPLTLKVLLEGFDSKNVLSPEQIDKEEGEFKRAGISTSDAKQGARGITLSAKTARNKVDNTDAGHLKSLKDWARMMDQNKAGLSKPDRKLQRRRVFNQVKSDTDEPSIIAKRPNGQAELVAGNTRASLRSVLGKPIKAHYFKVKK